MDRTRQYFYTDEARIQCYKGYKQIGSNIVKCSADQEFDTLPTCEGKMNETVSTLELLIMFCFNRYQRMHSVPLRLSIYGMCKYTRIILLPVQSRFLSIH